MSTLQPYTPLIGGLAVLLFCVVAVAHWLNVRSAQKRATLRLISTIEFWSWLKEQELRAAETNVSSLTYPIHQAKASVYDRCIAEAKIALRDLNVEFKP